MAQQYLYKCDLVFSGRLCHNSIKNSEIHTTYNNKRQYTALVNEIVVLLNVEIEQICMQQYISMHDFFFKLKKKKSKTYGVSILLPIQYFF